ALIERTLLSSGQAEQARTLAGMVVQKLGGKASFAIGFSESGSALTAQLVGRGDPAFLVAQDPAGTLGFDSRVRGASAIRQQFGRWGVTGAIETGDALSRNAEAIPALRNRYRQYGYAKTQLTLDRRFGPLAASVSGTRLAERDTVLGAKFTDGLGGTRAVSYFLDVAARIDAGAGWSVGGSLRRGWSLADVRGGVTGGGTIRTSAFAADIGKDALFGSRDSIGLRVSQPLRVSRGGIDLRLPTDYDYDTGAVTAWSMQTLNLAPTGRELDAELRYSVPVWLGQLQSNLFFRRNPGNFASLPDDKGAAVRWSMDF
ncbi:MAG: peptidase S8, partial [Sphingomonas sp.]